MGLLDKVKETAGKVAAEAKKAGEKAAVEAKKGAAQLQTKVEQAQLRRKADDRAKELGYLVYRERSGGAAAGQEADRLVAEIADLERRIAEAGEAEAAGGSATPVS